MRCVYDPASRGGNAPDGRKVQGTLHWVAAAEAVSAEVRLYNQLFTRPIPGAEGEIMNDLNPASLEILEGCLVERALADAARTVQFERQGYFCPDYSSTRDKLVFNRTIGLRDTWGRMMAAGGPR